MDDLSQVFGSQFDASAVTPMDDFAPIPPANYTCLIEGAEIKETKSRTGHGLSLQLSVVEGNCTGRKVFDFINIVNPNRVCEEMGRRVLAALAIGVGLRTVGPVAELVGKVVVAHVKVKDDKNNVRTYSAPEAAAIALPTAASPAVAPAAPVTSAPMDPAVHSEAPGYYTPPSIVPVAAAPPSHYPTRQPAGSIHAPPGAGLIAPPPPAKGKPWNQNESPS